MKSKIKKLPFEIVIIVAMICTVIFNQYVFHPVIIDGTSMYPTLKDNQFAITNIIGKNKLERFDIVCIDTGKKVIIKRLIGMPGDYVEYKDNTLYINGIKNNEPYLSSTVNTSNFEMKLSDNEYCCLGDNRENSLDSRYYGAFNKEQIVSKGAFVLF